MFEQVNADWDKPKQFMQIINLKRFHAVNLPHFVKRNIRLKGISATSLECKSNDWFLFCVKYNTGRKWVKINVLYKNFLDIFTRLIYVPTQLTFTCTKSTIQTLKKVWNMLNVKDKNTRTTSMTSYY